MKKPLDPRTAEFVRLLKVAGWSQAETARQLRITPGAVSQICSGRTRPRAATLNLLKLLVEKKDPTGLKAYERQRSHSLAPWENDMLDSLRRLPEAQRASLISVMQAAVRAVKTARRKTLRRG